VSDRLREIDYACIDAAGSIDSALLLETLSKCEANVCGADPIALLLDVLGDRNVYQSVLDYQTSGEREGDYRHSVSYAALGYYPREAFDLNEADRAALLDAAAATLRRLREGGERTPQIATGSPALGAHRGAFVSLHHGEELLGCIGNCSAREPLSHMIGELTLAAALDDPRFRPASTEQGPIDVEISLLTPIRRIRDTAAFQLGKHGAVLRLGAHSGLLLPQVAAGRGWSSVDFWRALARKSLLAPFAWSDPNARLDIFEAQIFERRNAA
jgi:AmmeMemoRadiSam system protein A